MKQNKIVIFTGSFRSGGAEKVAINIANSIAKRGLETYLVVFINDGPYASLVSKDVNVILLNASRIRYSLLKAVRIIRKINPDSVLSTQRSIHLIVGLATKLVSSALVTFREATTFDSLASLGLFKRLSIRALTIATYWFADRVIANSKYTLTDFKRNIICDAQFFIIYNPITDFSIQDLSDFASRSVNHHRECYKIVTACRLEVLKDVETIIRAFKIFSAQFPDSSLEIYGEGAERSNLERIVKDLNLEEVVQFKGYVRDWSKSSRVGDLFCLASRWEGFGNVVVEAGLAGYQLILSDCPGGMKEITYGEAFARFFLPGDVEGLAAQMQHARLHPISPEWKNFIKNDFLVRFSIDSIVDRYLDVISPP